MYKKLSSRIARVKSWEAAFPAGTELGISESALLFRRSELREYSSPAGYGGQTIARILCEDCGWTRKARSVVKTMTI